MKRLSILVLALCLLAIACGSDAADESAQESTEPETPTLPANADPEPVEQPLGAGPYPIGTVSFVITNGETGDQTANYNLSCLGDTATLTGDWTPIENEGIGAIAADQMCLALNQPAVQTRLIDGPATDVACAEIFGSADRAQVTGELNGSTIATMFSRSNGCNIEDWDNVMAGLLPLANNG